MSSFDALADQLAAVGRHCYERGWALGTSGNFSDVVRTHEHHERLPVIPNTQDWGAAVPQVEAVLRQYPAAHGFLIRRHGLYTWGRDLAEAKRHVEILEFLFEAMGRKRGRSWQP